MTMLVCPECKRIVDDSVKNCPGCRYNIRKYVRDNAKAAKQGSSTAFLGAITLSSVYDSKEKLPINTPKLEFLSASSGSVVFDSPSLNSSSEPSIFDSPALNAAAQPQAAPQQQETSIFDSPALNAASQPQAAPQQQETSIFDSPALNAAAAQQQNAPQSQAAVTTSIFDSPILNAADQPQTTPQSQTVEQPIFESLSLNSNVTKQSAAKGSIFDSPILNARANQPAPETSIFDSPILNGKMSAPVVQQSPAQNVIFESPSLNGGMTLTTNETSIFDSPVLNGIAPEPVQQETTEAVPAPVSTNQTSNTYAYNPLLGGTGNAPVQETPIFESPVLNGNGLSAEFNNSNNVNTPNPLLGGGIYHTPQPQTPNPVFSPLTNAFGTEDGTAGNPLLGGGNPLLGAHNPLLGQSR